MSELLSSALDTFIGIREETRRQRLADLQMESYRLRNEGFRLDNRFDRETYDDRLRQESGDADYREGLARKAGADATVAEGTVDSRIGLEAQKLSTEAQRTSYWGANASKAHSDATVAASTVQSRIDEARAKAREAGAKADIAARNNEVDATDLLAEEATQILGDRSFDEALMDPTFQARGIARIQRMYNDQLHEGQEVAGIIPTDNGMYALATVMDGKLVPITENRSSDPNDAVVLFSRDEAMAAVLGKQADDGRVNNAQNRLIDDDVYSEASNRLSQAEQARNDLEAQVAGSEEKYHQGVADSQRSDQIAVSLASLKAERDSLAPATSDWRGVSAANRSKLNALDEQIEALEEEQADLTSYTRADHEQVQERASARLSELPSEADVLRDAEVERRRLRDVRTASGGDGLAALNNRRATGDATQSATDRKAQLGVNEAEDKAFTTAVDDIVGALDTDESFVGEQELAASLRGVAADNPELVRMLREGTPEQRSGATAMLHSAALTQANSGIDAQIAINSMLRYNNPAITQAFADVVDDDFWRGNRHKPEDRYRVAERVAVLMDNGVPEQTAKSRAMQEFKAR